MTAMAAAEVVAGAVLVIGAAATPRTGTDGDLGAGIEGFAGGMCLVGATVTLGIAVPLLAVGLDRRKVWRKHHPLVSVAPARNGGMLQIGGSF
jgi:hypothetical protein